MSAWTTLRPPALTGGRRSRGSGSSSCPATCRPREGGLDWVGVSNGVLTLVEEHLEVLRVVQRAGCVNEWDAPPVIREALLDLWRIGLLSEGRGRYRMTEGGDRVRNVVPLEVSGRVVRIDVRALGLRPPYDASRGA